jgi:hypothetical protein
MKRAQIRRHASAGAAGVLIGAAAGIAVVVLAGAGVAQRVVQNSQPLIEATHLPALLTVGNEQVELRYDVYCQNGDESDDIPCAATGTVFLRTGDSGLFEAIPARIDTNAAEGRYLAVVPERIARSRDGFSYYAVFQSDTTGAEVTLPTGGGDAPQRSLPLERRVQISLGRHTFGGAREADARVVEAAWGDGEAEVGLEQSPNLPPIGASSFDVDETGGVAVLDEAHRRLLRWKAGARSPAPVQLAIDGTLADVSLADDGTIYVLESATLEGGRQRLRVFSKEGVARNSGETAEHATQVRMGPDGPVVLQQPSGQWMDAAADGQVLTASSQRKSGRAGRPTRAGDEVVVLRRGHEVRAAVLGRNRVRRSWRVTSESPLAEVQLAEPLGDRLVLVVRVYTDEHDEFVVLVLGARGIVRSLALDSADWAETAPLSRFRLAGSSLYQLGSTPAGIFVDRFDLEVK